MTVVIDPNIRKESEMIDVAGNVIDPRTKKIIKKEPPAYVPPPAHVLEAWKKEKNPSPLGDKIAKLIEEKVAKIVEEKIEEALKDL